MMLSITPELRRRLMMRLMVERLTCSSLAMPFQLGRTMDVEGSIRRSSDISTWLSISHASFGGRPLGLPVALWLLLVFMV